MALTPEDKADVKGAMGKAIANKVAKVTRDRVGKDDLSKRMHPKNLDLVRRQAEIKNKYTRGSAGSRLTTEQIADRVKNWNKTSGKNHDIMGS